MTEAEESQEEQERRTAAPARVRVDARAEMSGDQADDGESDPDAQEMEADGEPEMGGEGDEGMLPVAAQTACPPRFLISTMSASPRSMTRSSPPPNCATKRN